MTKLIWFIAIILAGIWSLFALAARAILQWLGSTAALEADRFSSDPQTVESLSWLLGTLGSVSGAAALIIWLLGLAAILIGAWLGVTGVRYLAAGRSGAPRLR